MILVPNGDGTIIVDIYLGVTSLRLGAPQNSAIVSNDKVTVALEPRGDILLAACTGRPDLDGTMPDSEITIVGEPKRVSTISRT